MLEKNGLSVPAKMSYGIVWNQEWFLWIDLLFYLITLSKESTCLVSALYNALMEMAEYVKNKELRK